MSVAALVWMVVLLVLNGYFVAAEFAFTAARREIIVRDRSRSARAAAWLMTHLSDTLAGAQLGITICSLLLGFIAEPAVASMLESALGFVPIPSGVLHSISFVIALLIVVFLHMVIGEMAPKNIAISTPERAALAMGISFRVYMLVFRPVIALLNTLANFSLRLFGVEPRDALETARSAEDLAQVIAAGRQEGVIEEFASKLLSGAIQFSDTDASEVMVPRPDIVARPVDATPAELEQVIMDKGFSRIPIYGSNVDDLLGFVHAKDLLEIPDDQYGRPIDPNLIRPVLAVPETASIRPVLGEMQRSGRHLALVVDEHGGTAGLLTLEDIVEELVGDIRDEYDEGDIETRRIGESDWFYVPGATRPDQLRSLVGMAIPPGEYETLGGFLMDRLGRIPRRGDRVEEAGWVMRVRRMDGRRVTEVELLKR